MKKTVKMFLALGTLNVITIFSNQDRRKINFVIDKIEDFVNKLDDQFSIFKCPSEISTINNNAGVKFTKVNKDTFTIIKLAKMYSMITNGAFDITTKPLSDLWKKNKLPISNQIRSLVNKVNYQDIILDEKNQAVMLKNKGQAIDLGAIAKGYIIDKIKEILNIYKFNNAIINLGGTVSSLGEIRNVGIRNPFIPISKTGNESYFAVISCIDENIVTSGVYEQCFTTNGVKYHHILDPRTGFPSESNLVSVTLIGSNGSELDALATACFVLGLQSSVKLICQRKLKAIFVLDNGKIYLTDNLRDCVKFLNVNEERKNEK